jgi:hypothetical protein
MKRSEFWAPVIVSFIATPIALILGIGSGGVGHGDYFWAKMLFPYTMLSTFLFESITAPFILLAIAQFPLYGVSLGYANGKGRFALLAVVLLLAHLGAVAAIQLLDGESFS